MYKFSLVTYKLTSPHGSRLLNSMPVIGVPVGGSKMFESIISHSTLRGLFCISLYSSSNISRKISSLWKKIIYWFLRVKYVDEMRVLTRRMNVKALDNEFGLYSVAKTETAGCKMEVLMKFILIRNR